MPVNRATSIYVIMLVLFGAGLWAILSFGSILLHAPTDLSGRWELRAGDSNIVAHTLFVQQSGKYFNIQCDQVYRSLKLVSQKTNPDNDKMTLWLAGNGMDIELQGRPDSDSYSLLMRSNGPMQGQWLATRVQRTYPRRHANANPGH